MTTRDALAEIYARAAPVSEPYDIDALWESNRDRCNEIFVELHDEIERVELKIRFAGRENPDTVLAEAFKKWQRRVSKAKGWGRVAVQAQCLVESDDLQDLVLRGIDGRKTQLAWVKAAHLVWIIHCRGIERDKDKMR